MWRGSDVTRPLLTAECTAQRNAGINRWMRVIFWPKAKRKQLVRKTLIVIVVIDSDEANTSMMNFIWFLSLMKTGIWCSGMSFIGRDVLWLNRSQGQWDLLIQLIECCSNEWLTPQRGAHKLPTAWVAAPCENVGKLGWRAKIRPKQF